MDADGAANAAADGAANAAADGAADIVGFPCPWNSTEYVTFSLFGAFIENEETMKVPSIIASGFFQEPFSPPVSTSLPMELAK